MIRSLTALAVAFVLVWAAPRAQQADPPQAFRATTDVVEIDATVLDGRRPVAGLSATDFVVTDNGVRQDVLTVDAGALPIDLTLVLDVSGSITDPLQRAIDRAVARVRARLRPGDRISILTFNQQVHRAQEQVSAEQVRAPGLTQRSGLTSLNDALAVGLVHKPVQGRRQMVLLFTDGVDTAGFLDAPLVTEIAGRSNAAAFIVAQGLPPLLPVDFFQGVADVTGGLVQLVPPITPRTQTEMLDTAFLRAFDEYRASYLVRYVLAGVPKPGWHDVVIRVVKRGAAYDIRARRRYFSQPSR